MDMHNKGVKPPWVAYPEFPAGDFFWRDAGAAWYDYEWSPFWQSLNEQEKQEYLDRWKAPEDWRWFFEWLETSDE